MKKTSFLSAALLLTIHTVANSQTTPAPDSIQTIEEAKYLKEELTELISKSVKYPVAALEKDIQGDVVLSFTIDKNGRLDWLTIQKTPDITLSTSAIVALNSLEQQWIPCRINGMPVDKKYKVIFRYRTYQNIPPSDYKSNADATFKKQKYEKALKLYDKAIKDNQYDSELFRSRSKTKDILGDLEGSKQDRITSDNLKNEVLSIVNINAKNISSKTERTIIRTSIEVKQQ